MIVVNVHDIYHAWNDTNEQLAVAFERLVDNQVERSKLLKDYPALENAVVFYERAESNFCKKNDLNIDGLMVLLNSLKDNIRFQIEEDGPESFAKVVYAS